jgi:predicted nucleotidyltransferase
MDNFGLPTRTIDEIIAYFKTKSNIEKVLIFGSRAKGTFHNGSDIDFAVFSQSPDSAIAGELDDLPTPYKFDVIDYNTLSHETMKNNIDRDGKLFYLK